MAVRPWGMVKELSSERRRCGISFIRSVNAGPSGLRGFSMCVTTALRPWLFNAAPSARMQLSWPLHLQTPQSEDVRKRARVWFGIEAIEEHKHLFGIGFAITQRRLPWP